MKVQYEFQKWTVSRIREFSICGLTSILVLGSDSLPTHAASWISIPGIRKAKEKAPVAAQPAPDYGEAIFKLIDDAKAEEKKGNLDRAIALAEHAKKLADSTVSDEEPSTKVLVTASSSYLTELKSRKASGTTTAKKLSPPADEKVVSRPKATEQKPARPKTTEPKVAAKPSKDESGSSEKHQTAKNTKPTPKTHRSGKIDERATISKAMKTEMDTSGKRPSDTKSDVGKSSALAEALEPPKQQLKPSRQFQKAANKTVTPALSAVAEKPNGPVEKQPAVKIAAVTVTPAVTQFSEPLEEPEFDPFPDDHPKLTPANKVVTRKRFTELWDAQGESEDKPKSAEPAWTAENEKPKSNDILDWAEKQDESLSRSDEPAEDRETVDARRSMRIKLRPRHSSQEGGTAAAKTEVASTTSREDQAPQIHPMRRSSATSWDDTSDLSEFKPDASNGDASSFESRNQVATHPGISSEDVAESGLLETDTLFEDESSNNDFPSKKVLELKRRLESCASLQPGDIATHRVSNPLTELFAADEAESLADELVAESNSIPSETKSDETWGDSSSSDDTTVAQAEPTKSEGEPNELSGKRVVTAEVTARMSLIRWRAAPETEEQPLASSDQSENAQRDIRESLVADLQSRNESLLSLPSVSIGLTEHPSRSVTEAQEHNPVKYPTLKGSAWDNASVPNVGFSTSASSNRRTSRSESLNSDIAPPAPVEQISFDGRLRHESGGTNSGEFVNASVIDIPEIRMPPVANISYSKTAPKEAEESSVSNTAGTFDEGTNAVVLSGPIERFAFVCGISTPAAAACLGALAMAIAVAGFFALRSAVHVALIGRNTD